MYGTCWLTTIVEDQHHLDPDPDHSFQFVADPDPTSHLDADPDQIAARIRFLLLIKIKLIPDHRDLLNLHGTP